MSNSEIVKCDFGNILDKPCNKLVYSRSSGLNKLNDLDNEKQAVLLWRSGLTDHKSDDMTICNYHLELFGCIFERNKTKCCGIINKHKRKVKGQKVISLGVIQKGRKWGRGEGEEGTLKW